MDYLKLKKYNENLRKKKVKNKDNNSQFFYLRNLEARVSYHKKKLNQKYNFVKKRNNL